MMRHHRAVLGFWGPVFRSSSGSTLLWMIGALVVLGSVAAGVAFMSPSASRGKLEQEAAMRAFYNANAGLQFLNSANDAGESANINFSNFTSRMGGTGLVTYTMPDNGTFSYQLGNIQTNGVNGTYQITNLIGTVQDANDKSAYVYSIYGGGKGSSVIKGYTPSDSGGNNNVPSGSYTNKIVFAGSVYNGNYIFTDANFTNGGVIINGSIDYVGGVTSSADGCLHMVGSQIGKIDESSHICANTCLVLDGGNNYYGKIYSQGDITVANGNIYGEIHAGGSVVLTWSSHVHGDIYTNGTLTFNGKAYTGENIDEIPTSILSGVVYFNAGIPDRCKTYSLPEHELYSGGKVYNLTYTPENNWTGEDTIYGSKYLDDHTYKYSSFTTDGGTKLCLDLSGDHKYINIFISEDMELKGTIYVKTVEGENCFQNKNVFTQKNYLKFADSSYASKVYFDVNGISSIKGGSNFFGTLYSKGDIKAGGGSVFIGALYTNETLDSSGGVLIDFVASDYANANWKKGSDGL